MSEEEVRLRDPSWKKWGPYLSERQWGTVREDYSPHGSAWEYFPHDHARSRTYRWGEDGIGGICDDRQHLCFALALWNGRDPILKERLFGLTGNEGNHSEDVKEYYYYLDSTPTHSYMRMLYKYPQREFPYGRLVQENARRTKQDPEFELIDTGVLAENRYWDVFIEYAKQSPLDTLIKITAWNRGPDAEELHLIPQLWFRNIWGWGPGDDGKPRTRGEIRALDWTRVVAHHESLGEYELVLPEESRILFCENETNRRRHLGEPDARGFFKDGFHEHIINNRIEAVNPDLHGTKCAVWNRLTVPPGESKSITLRLRATTPGRSAPFDDFDRIFETRQREADAFYEPITGPVKSSDGQLIQRQAFAGLLWSKQYYRFNVRRWLSGDPGFPPPPGRKHGRNSSWEHLNNSDVISMPDKWEYPWYAGWDLAFHMIPFAQIDPHFAKQQLLLLTREWYMHPNGQLPAYEWALGDSNPPVHAWAAWRVYKIDQRARGGEGDLDFLERIFHKLCVNFTWWVNRKDAQGNNIFQGGFLGLDNIGIFDRSAELPTGGYLEQADGTAWMAMYSLNMMRIGLELSLIRPSYQDMALKFFEHFLYIAEAMMNMGGEGLRLWDQDDGFYYDVLMTPQNGAFPMKIRSMVGLIPLFAVEVLEPELLDRVPEFKHHLEWFLENRPELAQLVSRWQVPGAGERRLLSLLRGHRMKRLLRYVLDETEFLSTYGVRALSKYHQDHPYEFAHGGQTFKVEYRPAESDSRLFGGNSNWRGPIWFPVNYLIIESLQKFHHYYGEEFKVECPTGSGNFMHLGEVARELSLRLCKIFLRDGEGNRAVFGPNETFQHDPHFRDYVPFFEYFHGDDGRGVGASHQTGWTALVAKLIAPRRGETSVCEAMSDFVPSRDVSLF